MVWETSEAGTAGGGGWWEGFSGSPRVGGLAVAPEEVLDSEEAVAPEEALTPEETLAPEEAVIQAEQLGLERDGAAASEEADLEDVENLCFLDGGVDTWRDSREAGLTGRRPRSFSNGPKSSYSRNVICIGVSML